MLMIDELVEDLKAKGIPVGVYSDTSKVDCRLRGRKLAKQRAWQKAYRIRKKLEQSS